MIISFWTLLRMWNILDKLWRKRQDTHFTFNKIFLKIVPFMTGGKNTKCAQCISTATTIMQVHHNIMLNVHCVSCLILNLCVFSDSDMNRRRVCYLKMVSMPRLYSIRDECGALTKWNQQVYKQSAQRNTCPTATLSTTNPTWADVGLKLGLCSAMPATNCLSCCTDRGGTTIWDRYPYMAFILDSNRIHYSCSSLWI